LTRQPQAARSITRHGAESWGERDVGSNRARLIPLSSRSRSERSDNAETDEGIRFVVERLLSLDDGQIAEACRRWSATPVDGDAMNRLQAQQVWALRLAMPERARTRFDALPIAVQVQLAELYTEVWSAETAGVRRERRA
jgi:hypothetical protein